ncbi:MAG: cytochrome c [Candidatus Eremiobacteraeota bacterium]|nr:cytochrome c [Candidatus Eremiobacteraeota bacterium]
MHTRSLRTPLLCAVALMSVAACSGSHPAAETAPAASTAAARESNANGRSIFLSGKDLGGVQISARKPPLFRSCAACHRADGSGGIHLPGGAVSADLRHAALTTAQKKPYTVALLERAISTGIDNMGASLNPVMPRWQLSKRDLHAVAVYVFGNRK